MAQGTGSTLRLSDGTADAIAGFHHRAYAAIDATIENPTVGDVGDGADHIDAIVTQLAAGVRSVAHTHATLGYSAQVNAHGVNSLDQGVQDAFDDFTDR